MLQQWILHDVDLLISDNQKMWGKKHQLVLLFAVYLCLKTTINMCQCKLEVRWSHSRANTFCFVLQKQTNSKKPLKGKLETFDQKRMRNTKAVIQIR